MYLIIAKQLKDNGGVSPHDIEFIQQADSLLDEMKLEHVMQVIGQYSLKEIEEKLPKK